ncbi:MAG: adenosine deaminase [Novosphingobium sp.]
MTGAPPARRNILITAAPIGFGPASKAWLIAEELRRTHSVTINISGDAAEFLQANAQPDVPLVNGAFGDVFHDRASLAGFDAFIAVNQMVAMARLARIGLPGRSILVDSLTHWRSKVDEIQASAGLLAHLVQDYPALEGALSQTLPPEVTAVAPIIHRGARQGEKRGIVIHTGGMAVPTDVGVPFREAVIRLFGLTLEAALEKRGEVSFLGNPYAIRHIPGVERATILGSVSPVQAAEAIGKAELLISTPGIGAVYEAISQDTPVILLPPTNSTQISHYRVLTGQGMAGTLPASIRDKLAQVMEHLAWEKHKPYLIEQLARNAPAALAGLKPLLGAFLDPAHEARRTQAILAGRRMFSALATLPATQAIETALASLPNAAPPAPATPRAVPDSVAEPPQPLAHFVASLPKVELHLHLEGALSPDFTLGLAQRHRIPLPFKDPASFFKPASYADFAAFANRILFNAHCLRNPRDFEDAAFALGELIHASCVRYAEVMWTPQLYLNRAIGLDGILAALDRGRARVREAFGIELRWIADLVRSYPGPAPQIAQWACLPQSRARGMVALGLGGPEANHPARPFAACFEHAARNGLGRNPHAGENDGPASIVETLDLLKPDRIAHGIRAVDDPSLMARIADQGVVLDICPSSNIRLGVRPDYAQLRLDRLRGAGCRITLNTDDPALFDTDLNREYRIAMQHCGLDAAAIGECIATAVEAARLDGEAKDRLRAEILPEVARLVRAYAGSAGESTLRPV